MGIPTSSVSTASSSTAGGTVGVGVAQGGQGQTTRQPPPQSKAQRPEGKVRESTLAILRLKRKRACSLSSRAKNSNKQY